MLLQKLKEYADQRMELPPPLYAETPIGYIIELRPDGTPLNARPTATSDPSEPRSRRGVRRLAPEVVRTSAIRPLLLADTAEYTLGIARDATKQGRVDERHQAYLGLLRACADATREPAVAAVRAFFDRGGTRQLDLDATFDPAMKLTFRVHETDGPTTPIDLPSVQRFWAEYNDPAARGAELMQCIVCGQDRPVVSRLQAQVKGIGDPRTAARRGSSRSAIISANAEAFLSYGLEASRIAPTCADCGERFTRAVNELLDGEATHTYQGNSTFIAWTTGGGFDGLQFLTNPDPGAVKALVDSVRSGRWNPSFDERPFYAAAFSPSRGRVAVRDWINTTVGEVKRQFARWFQRQSIVEWDGSPGTYLGVNQLAAATIPIRGGRADWDRLSPAVARALMRGALVGTPLPARLMYEAIRRCRADQRVNRQRAALIKLVLLSQDPIEHPEDYMTGLQPELASPAYQCGRLLAVLEKIQRRAMPTVNATVVDRFFGTASSAPASVFGRLVRGAQPHLSRLERDTRGAYVSLQREMEEVMHNLDGFPRTLTLEEQGLFALGYYHQRAYRASAAQASSPEPSASLDPETN